MQCEEWVLPDFFDFLPPIFLNLPDSLAKDDFAVSPELAVFGGDLDVVVVVVAVVFVVAMVAGSKPEVDEDLGLIDGARIFLPSSMSRSKTNPMTALRCGVWPSPEVLSDVMNASSFKSEDFSPVSKSRRSSVRIVVCLRRIDLQKDKHTKEGILTSRRTGREARE